MADDKIVKSQYQLGHVKIELQMPKKILVPKNLQKFICKSEHVDRIYLIEEAESLDKVEQNCRKEFYGSTEIRRDTACVLSMPEKECRILKLQGAQRPYAISLEKKDAPSRVWVDSEILPMMRYETLFLSLLSLEKLMLEHDSVILHSAYIKKDGKAILFSAPPETGKSTQAGLWETYRDARTINGDRSLLIREPAGWYAYGWPVCGSSGICYNENYPIQAIVMLHQAKTNQVRRITGFEAVQKLMAQITVNMWNAEFQMKVMDMIEQILAEVPIYELGCNISEEAVECLEKAL